LNKNRFEISDFRFVEFELVKFENEEKGKLQKKGCWLLTNYACGKTMAYIAVEPFSSNENNHLNKSFI